jgi:hypothetical protein
MAILAMISTAFENAISESLHFQSLAATENGGTSVCRVRLLINGHPGHDQHGFRIGIRNPEGFRACFVLT